jgi:hypothetical protein
MLPRWFAPVARDQFGRPIVDEAVVAAIEAIADEPVAT